MNAMNDVSSKVDRRADDVVLAVRNVKKHYPIREGVFQSVVGHVKAVDGVSFDIRRGETVGLVGESGCGKSTLGRCVSGLSDPTGGGVYFGLSKAEVARLDTLLADGSAAAQAELAQMERRHRIDRL